MPESKKYYVYVLRSLKDGRRYVGYTQDVEHRFFLHNEGEVKSTAKRKPFELIYTEELNDKKSAMERERFFKTGKGREFLKLIGK